MGVCTCVGPMLCVQHNTDSQLLERDLLAQSIVFFRAEGQRLVAERNAAGKPAGVCVRKRTLYCVYASCTLCTLYVHV